MITSIPMEHIEEKKKVCCICRLCKPLEDFNLQKSNKDGRNNKCRLCQSSAFKKWRDTNRNQEVARSKKWRAENPDKTKQYREEKGNAIVKEWIKNNPEKSRVIQMNSENKRRALLENAGKFSQQEWQSRLEEYDYCCAYCLEPLNGDIEVEHMVPLCLGGTNTIDNIVPAHHKCNRDKDTRTPIELFMRGRLFNPRPGGYKKLFTQLGAPRSPSAPG